MERGVWIVGVEKKRERGGGGAVFEERGGLIDWHCINPECRSHDYFFSFLFLYLFGKQVLGKKPNPDFRRWATCQLRVGK